MSIKTISNSSKFLTELEGKNINFLLGAGASMRYLGSLRLNKPIKESLEDIYSGDDLTEEQKNLILLIFFQSSVKNGLVTNTSAAKSLADTSSSPNEFKTTSGNYQSFVQELIHILDSQGFDKPRRANIFTTNYDTFLEYAFDQESINNPLVAFNDGSRGFIRKVVSYRNYYLNTTHSGAADYFKREIPSINLYKLHGSLNWKTESLTTPDARDDLIVSQFNDDILKGVNVCLGEIDKVAIKCPTTSLIDFIINKATTEADIKQRLKDYIDQDSRIPNLLDSFLDEYKKLLIVSPNKKKFYDTVFEDQYYQMLRAFANELEKENSVLIVFGFSFKDEHILDILQRSIVNPTLQIFVVAYNPTDKASIESKIKPFNSHVYFLEENGCCGDFTLLNGFLANRFIGEQSKKGAEDYHE